MIQVIISKFSFFTELKKSSTDDDVKLSTFDTECSTNRIFSDEENDVAVIKSPDVDRNSKGMLCPSTILDFGPVMIVK